MKITLALVGLFVGSTVGFTVGVKTEYATRAYYVSVVTSRGYSQILAPLSRPWKKILFGGQK